MLSLRVIMVFNDNLDPDNDEMVIFWIGSGVSPQLLQDLFGTDDFISLDTRMVCSPFTLLLISDISLYDCI
jgi:hypothetical protein